MGSHRKKTPSSQQRKSHQTVSTNQNSSGHANGIHSLDNHHAATSTVAPNDNKQRYFVEEEEEDGFDGTVRALDFSKVLQDVEGSLVGTMTSSFVAITGLLSSTPTPNSGGSFRVTWKELVYLVLAIVVLAGLSIFMGVAAGITISIHYFDDTHRTPSFPRLEARERDLGPHQRVTTLDYTIASSNILHPSVGMSSLTVEEENKVMDLTLGRVITMSESGQRSVLLVVEEIPPLPTMMNNNTGMHINYSTSTLPVNVSGTNSTSDAGGHNGFVDAEKEVLLGGHYTPYRHRGPPDARFQLSSSKVHPKLCSDGVTIGFDNWDTLKAAVSEANALSAERFMKWNEYFASLETTTNSGSRWFDNILNNDQSSSDDGLLGYYYDEDVVFTICPGTTLSARKGPIFINAENILILCGASEEYDYIRASQPTPSSVASMRASFSREIPSCTMDVGGTHLAFGPHARNVLVRGLVFQSAKTSSLAFHYDGAQASFEDCIWVDNSGIHGTKYGAVADVNSTSNVNFYRCEIGSSLASVANLGGSGMIGPGNGGSGDGIGGPYGGMAPGFASFLSLRN
ncbi:expressed unknown protein [Seminavis robusta]|uniref:Uncharacterized protein n=1 Tax=Seminavis robusta TaxID=568900 RepID=A0A9N8DER5_9STRA|nr:expressed unknown protein [Seminavis robusta]|eukprot:Sro88_g046660.1 n/a (570) ;mRNA; r:92826-94535